MYKKNKKGRDKIAMNTIKGRVINTYCDKDSPTKCFHLFLETSKREHYSLFRYCIKDEPDCLADRVAEGSYVVVQVKNGCNGNVREIEDIRPGKKPFGLLEKIKGLLPAKTLNIGYDSTVHD